MSKAESQVGRIWPLRGPLKIRCLRAHILIEEGEARRQQSVLAVYQRCPPEGRSRGLLHLGLVACWMAETGKLPPPAASAGRDQESRNE